MSFCARCDKPITDGQKSVTRDIEAGSGPGAVIRVHEWCQPFAATQPRRHPTGLGAEEPWRF